MKNVKEISLAAKAWQIKGNGSSSRQTRTIF